MSKANDEKDPWEGVTFKCSRLPYFALDYNAGPVFRIWWLGWFNVSKDLHASWWQGWKIALNGD